MADVFVSYSRADAARVEMLVRAIEAHGLSAWWDRSIEQGADFGESIRQELEAAQAVVVCWSTSAEQSRWVRGEASAADAVGKYVGAMVGPGQAAVPFNAVNNANLVNWQGAADDLQLLNLLTAIGKLTKRADLVQLTGDMKKSLDDAAARRRAAEQAERAKEVYRIAEEQRVLERRQMETIDADAFAFLMLARKCYRFKDRESYDAAGRSWRTIDQKVPIFWMFAVTLALVAYFVVSFLSSGVIGIVLLVIIVPLTLLIGGGPASGFFHWFFRELSSWRRDSRGRYNDFFNNGLGSTDEPEFRNSIVYEKMRAKYEAQRDLHAFFKNRDTIWEAWEAYQPRSGQLFGHLQARRDEAKAQAR